MTKSKKQAHIRALFKAMINRIPVLYSEEDGNEKQYQIQRINLDGECDLYSEETEEIEQQDIDSQELTIKSHANK